MYADLLREHARRSGVPDGIQLLILQWVTHATRPLRLLELAEAIHVTNGCDSERDLKTRKELVRAAAGPLLEILADETVCVVHHSFTEYLKDTLRSGEGQYPVLHPSPTHGRLAVACLAYLCSGCLPSVNGKHAPLFDSNDDTDSPASEQELLHDTDLFLPTPDQGPFKTEDGQRQMRLRYPFLAYAVENWCIHVARSSVANFDQNEINVAIDRFFSDRLRTKAWLKFNHLHDGTSSKGMRTLHIAAKYGLTEYIRARLANNRANVHACDEDGKTPVWWAAANGHADTIRLLIESGAHPDQDDTVSGLKPLHQAAKSNHEEAVRVLLEAGVDPLTKRTRDAPMKLDRKIPGPSTVGQTPLMASIADELQ